MAAAGLSGEMKVSEIVGAIKDIDKEIKILNAQYSPLSDFRMKILKDAKMSELEELVPEAFNKEQN